MTLLPCACSKIFLPRLGALSCALYLRFSAPVWDLPAQSAPAPAAARQANRPADADTAARYDCAPPGSQKRNALRACPPRNTGSSFPPDSVLPSEKLHRGFQWVLAAG